MLFSSPEYGLFLAAVMAFYYLSRQKLQNIILLCASYIFYALWDWRFVALLLFTTCVDYLCGHKIAADPVHLRKRVVCISVFTNLGVLGFFKYCNFFIDSANTLLAGLHISASFPLLNILLPVGISFYTFKSLTYTIDIYRGKMEPVASFLDYALYVAFFPQLLAGPIDRARDLLPQIQAPRTNSLANMGRGVELFLYGLVKKVFIADNLSLVVNDIFSRPNATGAEWVLGAWAFAFQIYGDFSGYTDMARGTGKLLGFTLAHNFRQPYLAVNPSDFWRRWHMTLSEWLRDYIYIPLGGNRGSSARTYCNLMLTMLLGGLWHGSSWNFVFWGGFHGGLLCIHRVLSPRLSRISGAAWAIPKMFITFQLICLGWLFFRAESLEQCMTIIQSLALTPWDFSAHMHSLFEMLFYACIPACSMLLHYDWQKLGLPRFAQASGFTRRITASPYVKSSVFGVLCYLVLFLGSSSRSFIYFQF